MNMYKVVLYALQGGSEDMFKQQGEVLMEAAKTHPWPAHFCHSIDWEQHPSNAC